MTIIQLQGWNFDRVTHCLQKNMQCSLNSQPLFTVLHYLTTLCNCTCLTTIHSNSWDCPILPCLSQLLPDTLPDLISDTRSALLRDSLWWEAGKEDGNSNNDQTEHCHFDSCWFAPTQPALCTSGTATKALDCQSDGTGVVFIPSLIYAIS